MPTGHLLLLRALDGAGPVSNGSTSLSSTSCCASSISSSCYTLSRRAWNLVLMYILGVCPYVATGVC
ncbi:H(+)-ATPase 5 [Zea mays]|uniref:H(+)-ATPase 5 n=1 Tax=Zea mays TaxID=4577 RepID=A0A1D6GSK1_MAIZE|nr:H(+)-ATPase 5 [Zea mays]